MEMILKKPLQLLDIRQVYHEDKSKLNFQLSIRSHTEVTTKKGKKTLKKVVFKVIQVFQVQYGSVSL